MAYLLFLSRLGVFADASTRALGIQRGVNVSGMKIEHAIVLQYLNALDQKRVGLAPHSFLSVLLYVDSHLH